MTTDPNARPPLPALHARDRQAESTAGGGWLEQPQARESLPGLCRRQHLAQPGRVRHGPRRHHRVPRPQVGARARLPPDQGTLGLPRKPHRRPFRLRVARRQRQLVSFLRQRELGIQSRRFDGASLRLYQRPADQGIGPEDFWPLGRRPDDHPGLSDLGL